MLISVKFFRFCQLPPRKAHAQLQSPRKLSAVIQSDTNLLESETSSFRPVSETFVKKKTQMREIAAGW